MTILFSASTRDCITVQEICRKITDLDSENLLDPVLNYTEYMCCTWFCLKNC